LEWNDKKLDGGICQSIIDQLKYFASTQIRNVASLGGNIVNASPMSVLFFLNINFHRKFLSFILVRI
jgi:CO/xanthine dehydrogenase FAD-binding subunit